MVIHPSYHDACDVIYYVIAVRARRTVRIFFLHLGNRSKSDPCSYELFCLESHILSFPKVLQIPPESPCIHTCIPTYIHTNVHTYQDYGPNTIWYDDIMLRKDICLNSQSIPNMEAKESSEMWYISTTAWSPRSL